MAASFDRDELLNALDEVGRAAIEVKARLDIAVYGGSALMLASNFRFGTEDVDIAEQMRPASLVRRPGPDIRDRLGRSL